MPSPTIRAAILGVLEQLLAVGVTDSDHRVRKAVLTLLLREPRLDPYLSQNDTIQSLLVALNDEHPEIREIVICLLGRLCTLNPAFILPSLRRTLILVRQDVRVELFCVIRILVHCTKQCSTL